MLSVKMAKIGYDCENKEMDYVNYMRPLLSGYLFMLDYV